MRFRDETGMQRSGLMVPAENHLFSVLSEPAALAALREEQLIAVNGFSSAKMGSGILLVLISPLRAICSN